LNLIIAHQIEGRTRLRAMQRPVDAGTLKIFAEQLAQQPGIEMLDLRDTTGSVVIEHPSLDAGTLKERVTSAGGMIVQETSASDVPHDNLAAVRERMGNIDNTLTQLSAGGLDMRTLAFLVLFSLGITQLLRGQIMMPAFSFLWYAFELVKMNPAGPAEPTPGE
jgi:hypothetical protein